MADVLRVWLGAAEVGTLTRTRTGARFRYGDDVVAAGPGLPLLRGMGHDRCGARDRGR